MFPTFGFIFIAIFVTAMIGFGSWLNQKGKERKEEGKPNFLRPIIIVVVSAMALIILLDVLR